MKALVATFIMAEIIDPSQYFSSPYHVSSQQHMICSIGTQQERQIFGDQSKAMNDTNRSSFGRQYTSNVCSYCGKIGHVIDTCYRRHDFPPQFKFKNHKADYNNNQQNHEGSRSEVHSQHIGFTPEHYQILLTLLQQSISSDNVSNQISGIASNTTTHTGNKFLTSFSSWIIDIGATDHICSSLSSLYYIHKLIPFI